MAWPPNSGGGLAASLADLEGWIFCFLRKYSFSQFDGLAWPGLACHGLAWAGLAWPRQASLADSGGRIILFSNFIFFLILATWILADCG